MTQCQFLSKIKENKEKKKEIKKEKKRKTKKNKAKNNKSFFLCCAKESDTPVEIRGKRMRTNRRTRDESQ